MNSSEKLSLAIDQLSDAGYFIWDDFIPNEDVKELVSIADEASNTGDFKKAGIGKQALFQLDKSIRGDYIQWLDRNNENAVVLKLLDEIERLKTRLNETCYLGLRDFETHFAIYPENTFYKRHVDRFQQNAHRVISFVLYLNRNWQEGDGGELAIYLDGKTEVIQPLAGRLLLFRSELEHEVLMSYKKRYSITGWMLDKDMSLTFLP
ncbi:SM-20 protein [Marivirga tractuosa]|uniref:2OG-Fe(II) oxygenase n=1 Tax=Marivirga tractuosa (strain ATCC 23168 / DSM 4126 / NBRC 15989 / NCIMB 1408 / VKM B-1430 / H-43) TaxID=643867 RepID=E4TU40_MARTH|nr:2OG-Fe(II) oxygenase [Marivirga tractuosa]ADR23062.1 2OG-Fe(II) oxygenase [Marivirga tractuosa DSM 4126]BDD16264.1 SM-20 protein [Marivirga tractuosa]